MGNQFRPFEKSFIATVRAAFLPPRLRQALWFALMSITPLHRLNCHGLHLDGIGRRLRRVPLPCRSPAPSTDKFRQRQHVELRIESFDVLGRRCPLRLLE